MPRNRKDDELDTAAFPEEYSKYKGGAVKWMNKTAWAREYLKRKRQIDGTERGVWKITELGRERIRALEETRKDPDEGLAQLQGVDSSIAEETGVSPQEGFRRIDEIQIHETGGILGVRGIVYEPINE
ncbi:MAG: winged helix-turn-helix domain-containing protein [Dehalococcoidia bacterium]|nr:winged helix-turn-helix domain-containing protein [Dehalococcoidia bacterium]